MATTRLLLLSATALAFLATRPAYATEVCGNGIDDDGNGMVDEGCAPQLTTGVDQNPLSNRHTGMVSWSSGALHYDLPPDIAPRTPYGPAITFARFYTSQYAPPAGGIANINDVPMGARWQHTYMTWVTPTGSNLVLHTNQGRDTLFTYSSTVSGWKLYTPQAGDHVLSFKQNTVSPYQVVVQLLTGETVTYNNLGQLTAITDLAGNSVAVTSDANGSTSTVTDASGNRRLLFGYSGTTLQTVKFQLLASGTWTTEHTTTLAYTSGVPTSATIGSVLAQQYGYTSGYLTSITDGASNRIASFTYNAASGGKVSRVDTSRGSVGFDYSSTRTGCAAGGQTLLSFNKSSASGSTCSSDSGCSSGSFCGGKDSTGTGTCYTAGRCLTLGTANNESVITGVSVVSSSGASCTGACADVMAYVWSTATGLLNNLATEDQAGRYTSALYNSNGLPTTIVYGDTDSDATTVPANARAVYYTYDTSYPGRLASSYHLTSINVGKPCTPADPEACATTTYTYNAAAPYLLHTLVDSGYTLDGSGNQTTYSYTTTYTQDSHGRTTEVDGPLTGAKTTYDYFSSTDPTKNAFVQDVKRYSSSSAYLQQSIFAYDFFGHPVGSSDPNGNVRCDTFDSSRAYLTQTRYAMAGQTDCSTVNSADISTNWTRDSALRLTQMQRPDGSCVLNSYDSTGRLYQVKRRDDCVATSAGDYEQYTYTNDSLVSEIDTYNSSATITRKQAYAYFQSRRLQEIINPVNPTYYTALAYDSSGLLTTVTAENSLGQTAYTYGPGNDTRVTSQTSYYSGTGSDSWSFLYDWDGDQAQYTDGDAKAVKSTRDDRGLEVERSSADTPSTTYTLINYDAAGNVTTKSDQYGDAAHYTPITSTFAYDLLGRKISATYSLTDTEECKSPETIWSWDALPYPVSCPSGVTCANLAGHVAYVTTGLICSTSYGDGSLDQQTFYSYDANNRMVREHITDDSGRAADSQYQYTKNGALSHETLPSGAVYGFTYGSTSSDSDSDRISAVWRGSAATPFVDTVEWFPFGPLQQYNHENDACENHSGACTYVAERTRITRNLAYRISDIRVETQDGNQEVFGVGITEDAKGRVTLRDYADNSYGVQDSYFTSDNEDHLTCEATTGSAALSCPTAGSASIKNSHESSPPFTHAGDWKNMRRPIPGGSGHYANNFTLTTGTHQIATVDQPSSGLGTTYFTYDGRGNRASDYNTTETHADRTYTYDARGNVVNIRGEWDWGGWQYQDTSFAYDAAGKRVYKGWYDETTGGVGQLFFYYDPYDRLSEVRYTPNTSSPGTYYMYDIVWLGDRVAGFWETDYPSATTSRRYTGTDETGRIVDLETWPSSGAGVRAWAINPSAWGYDSYITGYLSVFQPFKFPGQYEDTEANVYENDGSTYARPALFLNSKRTYDPFTGAYLQVDPLVPVTASSYIYVDGDPVGGKDPSGLAECQDPTCGATNIGGGGEGAGYCSDYCYLACTVGVTWGCHCEYCGQASVPPPPGGMPPGNNPPVGNADGCPLGCEPQMSDGTVCAQEGTDCPCRCFDGSMGGAILLPTCTASIASIQKQACSDCFDDCAKSAQDYTTCLNQNCIVPGTGTTAPPSQDTLKTHWSACHQCYLPLAPVWREVSIIDATHRE